MSGKEQLHLREKGEKLLLVNGNDLWYTKDVRDVRAFKDSKGSKDSKNTFDKYLNKYDVI